MDTLLVRIEASRSGEPYCDIARGIRYSDGKIDFVEGAQDVPMELLDAFHRYLEEVGLGVGTWGGRRGDIHYRFSFARAS